MAKKDKNKFTREERDRLQKIADDELRRQGAEQVKKRKWDLAKQVEEEKKKRR